LKTPFEKIEFRTEYYKRTITAMLNLLKVDMRRVKFVKGMDYQLEKDIMIDLFKLMSITKVSQAKKAGAEVVKKSDDPTVTSLLYPALQALDEKYLNADAELGGIDQRKIFAYGRDFMPGIGIQRKFTHLMNPIISLSKKEKSKPGQEDVIQKMSASDSSSKIDLVDTPERIKKVMNKVFCLDGDITDNSALYLIKVFIFPIASKFDLIRNEENGGNVTFVTFSDLEQQVGLGSAGGGIHPSDLKNSMAHFFSNFLEPIREEFSSEENVNLIKLAYN
jgi:tyrosyl-tRNA synthetase